MIKIKYETFCDQNIGRILFLNYKAVQECFLNESDTSSNAERRIEARHQKTMRSEEQHMHEGEMNSLLGAAASPVTLRSQMSRR